MSSAPLALAEPILIQEGIPSSGHGNRKVFMLLALLLGSATIFSMASGRQEGMPSVLAAIPFSRTSRTSPTAGVVQATHRAMNPSVSWERLSHIAPGATRGTRHIVRADGDIEAKVKKMIADNLSVDEDKLKPEASFIEDLGADSLDSVELLMAMEEEFGVEIPEEEAQKMTTVQAVIDFAKSKA